MNTLSKRDVLKALAALGALAATPAFAQASPDLSAGRAIGEAYVAARNADPAALRRALAPNGVNAEAIAALRARVSEDFRASRTFTHNGWRLAETEAQLFAALL